MEMPKELVDLTLHLHAETEKAIRVSDDSDDRNAKWLPKSQCEVEKHPVHARTVEVTMPVWLAEEKGFV
jgi:hypothetical protein